MSLFAFPHSLPLVKHFNIVVVQVAFLRGHNDFRTSAQVSWFDGRLDLQRLLVAKPRYTFQLVPLTPAIDAFHDLTGILLLNISLLIPIMTSVVNGIDSSNLNGLSPSRLKSAHVLSSRITGLQVLPEWQDYFGHPQGWRLGKQKAMSMVKFTHPIIRPSHFCPIHWQLYRPAFHPFRL
jgi:hypothetical protein